MKKKIVGFLVAGALICAFSPFSGSAQAALNFGGLVGWCNPTYGKVNDDLEPLNERFGTSWKLESGLAYGLNLGYNLGPNWAIRGEYFSFSSKTSDSYSGLVGGHDVDIDYEIKASLGALILSGIYTFSPDKAFCPYAGVGIGLFSTELKTKARGDGSYYDHYEEWAGNVNKSQSDSASPIGFQLLGGAEYKVGENLSVIGEIRYISAKAEELFKGEPPEYNPYSTGEDIDWSGLSLGLGITYAFK